MTMLWTYKSVFFKLQAIIIPHSVIINVYQNFNMLRKDLYIKSQMINDYKRVFLEVNKNIFIFPKTILLPQHFVLDQVRLSGPHVVRYCWYLCVRKTIQRPVQGKTPKTNSNNRQILNLTRLQLICTVYSHYTIVSGSGRGWALANMFSAIRSFMILSQFSIAYYDSVVFVSSDAVCSVYLFSS